MKRWLFLTFAMLALLLPVGSVAAQDASTPGAAPDTAVDMPSVEYIDETGTVLAVLTVTAMEIGWSDYADFMAPQSGEEYVRFTVEIESRIGRGTFTVEPYFFFLQDVDGFLSQADMVLTADDDLSNVDPFAGILDLAGGETGELYPTFRVLEGVDLEALYFSNDIYSRLVTVAEFDEE